MQFDVTIEIPRGSGNKYEVDHTTGRIRLDRAVFTSMVFPQDYGSIDNTLDDDGDPLVLLPCPTFPGVVIDVRPVGMLRMVDENGGDDKILTVPANDDRFAAVQDIGDVPKHTLAEIEHFFAHYKELEHGKHVTTNGWADRTAAEAAIRSAQEAHTPHP
ncbi:MULTISPECIES: inorganic diphosphatase [Curtobacterium]|jgi:inorganic pyrophosphatase|uniref:Inorganic pyrophosphatase n=2 Tax=Curtobacterium TaxID=2034 RepID=A0A6G7GC03_9MICO|nr:inorganic diphosphatase [Curtobacterium flaccumfaciens]MBO9041522.1 inorganic diphosphatase [Curtobacterium flaccumfaciens pv. flaccumfaciens]MBO9045008.1 inorganic diphosphatase [Curtobacterium flaccumfaciens pv. flaccumfaciens]MBO9048850.1 inorganic diphosphatase [Curtobacterium flaccumfaciens pv. flaccumfaciens]MBO9057700.1 inorganic diphosphatase [Curtobacterium flaccumfaciens pv. flaccumfaciens]MBT1543041.1 inorganic diphosphatase [Curtobacterium flaccumfaciens pv. flaccumfaciens]